jgi:hypothetical protein
MTGERADQAARAGIAGALNMNYTAEDGGGIYLQNLLRARRKI